MRKEIQHWHSMVLATYQAIMFDSLIHPHNITTESAKTYEFEDEDEAPSRNPNHPKGLFRGYMAMKDVDGKKTKYFLEESYYKDLPIRVEQHDEVFYKDNARVKSVVYLPTDITPFKIKPECCWTDNHDFIDTIAPFQHTQPDSWTLNKIIAVMTYVGKTFLCICSLSEYGKSSIYLIFDAVTKKCPVFQPRSVPGVLAQITGDGNMVFDEVHDAASEVKSCMENFSLQVAGNSPIYINGAMRSTNTKPKYDVSGQSITYLFNVYGNYRDPEKQFWDNIWANRKAMQSRFLQLKLDGKLLEEFDKDFDIPKVASDNKMYYVKIAKHLLYLKSLKLSNGYVRRYKNPVELELKGRHKIIYDEITWGIDLYSRTQDEYTKFVLLLNKAINDYKEMTGEKKYQENAFSVFQDEGRMDVVEEVVIEPQEALTDKEKILAEKLNIKDIDPILNVLVQRGDMYSPKPGFVAVLR